MTAEPLLRVEDLRVGFGAREVVRGASFELHAGRCLAVVGESGSGKSVTARTLVGLTGAGSHVSARRLEFAGTDLRGLGDRQWRRIRGRDIGFVLQDALVSLDRLRPVGREVAEALSLHGRGNRAQRAERVHALLEEVGVPEPRVRACQLPHELSGGLRQRVLIAQAIALDPALLIADEPTTALDATVQVRILDLLAERKRAGQGLILVSHDLAVVSRLADEVAVIRQGEIVEQGPVGEVLGAPRHEYTKALLDAVPSNHPKGTLLSPHPDRPAGTVLPDRGTTRTQAPVLRASGLVKRFRGPDRRVRTAVDDVSFELRAGETLGVVGESGSGKTTTARMALALEAPDEGTVELLDGPWTTLSPRRRRPLRKRITVIYQDPLSSFDPRWSVEHVLRDSLDPAEFSTSRARSRRVGELLEQVGLGDEHRRRRPLHLSGGQRQRVAIARALAPRPSVIVCDEPVSALDVSIQAQVLDLLTTVQAELGVAYLFISHDLGVVHHMSDHVLVMKDGRVVEQGPEEEVFTAPRDPYTRSLLNALPALPPRREPAVL
ncbi:dipeptide ABC transporter ATP-binding protein [Saccharopolyspora sp. NPDC002578]